MPVFFLVLTVLLAGSAAAMMETVFTYQGRLMDAEVAADGIYDFEFRLFNTNDPCVVNQQGDTVEIDDLDVINGYFTAELDFGSDVFDGQRIWLGISVRPGDSNDPDAFVILSPRQEVTATPYSLHSRGIFVDNSGNVGIGTTNPLQRLHLADSGMASVVVHQTDNDVVGQLQADTEFVSLHSAFNHPLRFKINDITRAFLDTNGRFGIGTMSPRASLEVSNSGSSHGIWASTSSIPVYAQRIATTGTWPAVEGDCNSLYSGASGVRGKIISTNPGALSAGVYGYNSGTGSNGVGVRGYHDGSGAGVYGQCANGKGIQGVTTTGYAGYFTDGEKIPLEQAMQRAAGFGYDAVCFYAHRPMAFPMDIGSDRRKKLKELAQKLDIELGTVVACTASGGGAVLTGENYAFRPYFRDARRGLDVVYPALGMTTKKRGLFFSSPVYAAVPGLDEKKAMMYVFSMQGMLIHPMLFYDLYRKMFWEIPIDELKTMQLFIEQIICSRV